MVYMRAGMVVHPSPGHGSGTLVNAVLFHCGLPAVSLAEGDTGNEDAADIEVVELATDKDQGGAQMLPTAANNTAVLRPGIVHRLDKGTRNAPCPPDLNPMICVAMLHLWMPSCRVVKHKQAKCPALKHVAPICLVSSLTCRPQAPLTMIACQVGATVARRCLQAPQA